MPSPAKHAIVGRQGALITAEAREAVETIGIASIEALASTASGDKD